MPAKKRTTKDRSKKPPELTEVQKKLAVIMADMEKQKKARIHDIERSAANLMQQIGTYYGHELLKLPKAVRAMKLDDFLAGKGRDPFEAEKIEQQINNEIQLPAITKKLRTAKKVVPTPLMPPPPPSKSTTRKKRMNTNSGDVENAETAPSTKANGAVQAQASAAMETPHPNTSKTTSANETLDFDAVRPDSNGHASDEVDDVARTISNTAAVGLDVTRTIKMDDIGNENIPTALKKNFTAATLCRKPKPNEMLWSESGSPVVIDPRAALKQSKVQAAFSFKEGAIAFTGSPLSEDAQCPTLDPVEIDLVKKLYSNLAKVIQINETRNNANTDGPSTSSSNA